MPPKKRKAEAASAPAAYDGEEWEGGELSEGETFKKLEQKFSLTHQQHRRYADGASHLFTHDHIQQELKPDHASRPMWVIEDGKIILESSRNIAKPSQSDIFS